MKHKKSKFSLVEGSKSSTQSPEKSKNRNKIDFKSPDLKKPDLLTIKTYKKNNLNVLTEEDEKNRSKDKKTNYVTTAKEKEKEEENKSDNNKKLIREGDLSPLTDNSIINTDKNLLGAEDKDIAGRPAQRTMSKNKMLNKNIYRMNSRKSMDSDTSSSSDDNEEDLKDEIYQPWGKDFYLTCLAVKLEHAEDAVKYCDQMIMNCEDPLNPRQIKLVIDCNKMLVSNLRKQYRGLIEIINK